MLKAGGCNMKQTEKGPDTLCDAIERIDKGFSYKIPDNPSLDYNAIKPYLKKGVNILCVFYDSDEPNGTVNIFRSLEIGGALTSPSDMIFVITTHHTTYLPDMGMINNGISLGDNSTGNK